MNGCDAVGADFSVCVWVVVVVVVVVFFFFKQKTAYEITR